MERGYRSLLTRHPATPSLHTIPKVVVLGGDHAITLPVLRALKQAYGKPITVIHFDSHIDRFVVGVGLARFGVARADRVLTPPDSWKPAATAHPTEQWYHGSMFYWAWKEGLTTTRNVHVGIRTKLWGNDANDYREDESYGWSILEWNEIWKNGTDAAIKKIRERVGEEGPIYLSLDIDVVVSLFRGAVCVGLECADPFYHLLRRTRAKHQQQGPLNQAASKSGKSKTSSAVFAAYPSSQPTLSKSLPLTTDLERLLS